MTDLRAAAVGWVQRALTEVLKSDSDEIRTRAENLVAIAEEYRVPVQPVLLQWVHLRVPGKEWSGDEWTRYCGKYNETRAALEALGNAAIDETVWTPTRCPSCSELIETEPAALTHRCRMLCTRCYRHEAMRTADDQWFCPACGVL
jgi:predicted RNA-binding Zn-ribbon protein involved in translation (DUF1610 family)